MICHCESRKARSNPVKFKFKILLKFSIERFFEFNLRREILCKGEGAPIARSLPFPLTNP